MKKEVVKKEESKERLFGKSIFILFGIFLMIGIVFYVSLSAVKSGNNVGGASGGVTLSPDENKNFNLGVGEIIFSIVFALFMTGFLLWVKSLIVKNAYLGSVIGLVGSVILGYGFYLKYRGPYSIGFMIVVSGVVLVYVGMNFWRFKNENYQDGEEDEK